MADLNNLSEVKSLDKSNLLGSIRALADQISQAWNETQVLDISPDYVRGAENIVGGSMGGSGLGLHIFKNLFSPELKIPFEIINDYCPPAYVNEKTLVIISSYSGSTEEVLNFGKEALGKGAKVVGLCAGGPLAEFLRTNHIPGYVFEPKHNPSNQPRMGNGYAVAGLMGLMSKLGVVSIEQGQIPRIISAIKRADKEYCLETANLAKEVASKLKGRFAIIVGSEFLAGNAHAFANQLNENAKTFSDYQVIPELNHHLLEGLTYPHFLKDYCLVVFLESNHYFSRNRLRLEVTKKVLEKKQIPFASLSLAFGDRFEQSFVNLVFSSYVSFYLAILNDLDPTPIPWVDFFKEELKKTGT